MVDFTPTEWQEGEEGGTPITADQLNRMEQGIEDDATAATAAQAAAATAQSAASTAQSAAATAQSAATAAQSAASTAESDATTAQSTATAAQSAAATAATAAAAASTAAATAQGAANAAYVKPGGGIPATDLATGVQTALTAAGAAYVKPGPGIPKTDLTSAVQASLSLADSAYQAPAVVGAGATQASARSAIGAGTSSLALGTSSTTAKAGDYQPAAANVSDASFSGVAVLTGDIFKQLARNPDALIVGAITRDSNGAATGAAVKWPDASPGTYTALTLSTAFPGAVDSYSVTYGSPVTKTYTQPAVTRDATSGAVTAAPEIVVS